MIKETKQKKVCFLCAANIKHMTLISLYTDLLNKEGVMYDIIYIDKYHEIEEYEGAHRLFRHEIFIKQEWSFIHKFFKYLSFRGYAKKILESEMYDFIIVWNEFTSFLFADYLKNRYKNKYCINIRDENMNRFFPVQIRYKQALDGCAFATISSDFFRNVFPKFDYLFVHSLNKNVIQDIIPVIQKRIETEPIRIVFIGRMSYPETMKRVIDVLGNDCRFELKLIGSGCEEWESYVRENKINNVWVHGSFLPSETSKFLSDVDVIYSLNQENDLHCDTLLPIKLYYAIALHVPILVFKSSYTYEYARKYNMDIGITSSDILNLGDLIFKRYHELKQDEIVNGCKKALEDIELSHEKLNSKIKKFILEEC